MSSFSLICEALVVGRLENCSCDDDTWNGTIILTIEQHYGELAKRVLQFIKFCQEWNERVLQRLPSEASEFDEYSDLIKTGLWKTKEANGDVRYIVDAPVFFQSGEVSWKAAKERREHKAGT